MLEDLKTFRVFDTWIGQEHSEDYLDLEDTPDNRVYQMVYTKNPNDKVYTAKESYWVKLINSKKIRVYGMAVKDNRLVEIKPSLRGRFLSQKLKGYDYKKYAADNVRYSALTTILPKKTGRYTIEKIIETNEFKPMIYVLVRDNHTKEVYLKCSLMCNKFENEVFTNAVVLRGIDGGYLIPSREVTSIKVNSILDDADTAEMVNKAMNIFVKSALKVKEKVDKLVADGYLILSIDDYHYFINPEGIMDLKIGCQIYKELGECFDSIKNVDYYVFTNKFILGDMIEEAGASYCDFLTNFNLGIVKQIMNDDKTFKVQSNLSLNRYKAKRSREDMLTVVETDISGVRYHDFLFDAFEFNKRDYMKNAYKLVSGINESITVPFNYNGHVIIVYSKDADLLYRCWAYQFVINLKKLFRDSGLQIVSSSNKFVHFKDTNEDGTNTFADYVLNSSSKVGDHLKISMSKLRDVLSRHIELDIYKNREYKGPFSWAEIVFTMVNVDTPKAVDKLFNNRARLYKLLEQGLA